MQTNTQKQKIKQNNFLNFQKKVHKPCPHKTQTFLLTNTHTHTHTHTHKNRPKTYTQHTQKQLKKTGMNRNKNQQKTCIKT